MEKENDIQMIANNISEIALEMERQAGIEYIYQQLCSLFSDKKMGDLN